MKCSKAAAGVEGRFRPGQCKQPSQAITVSQSSDVSKRQRFESKVPYNTRGGFLFCLFGQVHHVDKGR